MTKRKNKSPALVWTLALWTVDGYPSRKREWSFERKLIEAKKAGFQAVTTYGEPFMRPLFEKHDLRFMGFFVSSKASEFRSAIKQQKEAGAENIFVQMGTHDMSVEKSVKLAIKLYEEAQKQEVPVFIETHRNTSTETPDKGHAIAKAFYEETGEVLPVCWDHSHWNVVKHLMPEEFSRRLLVNAKLHQASWICHMRPSNGHHCQIPVTNGHGKLTPEFKDWLPLAEDYFTMWLRGKLPTGEFWICPELGPNDQYGLSVFPDVFEDAKRCKKELASVWQRALKRA